jgi:hypothetical protein
MSSVEQSHKLVFFPLTAVCCELDGRAEITVWEQGQEGKSRRTGKNGRHRTEATSKIRKSEVRLTKLYHVDGICMSVLLPALMFALISHT